MSKMCVVTGTSSGIGAAVAETLLRQGWEVVGISRRPAAVQASGYREFLLDLSDAQATETFFEGEFLREVRPADFSRVALVNNAATLRAVGPQEQAGAQGMVRDFALNTVVPIWLGGYFIRHCPGARLYIIHISSGAAVNARAGWSTYCASKAALKMAGEVTVQDLRHFGHYGERAGAVSIVSYNPGTVATAMQAEIREHTPETFPSVQRFVGFHEQGELKSPQQPADEIAALLENEHLPLYSDVTFGG